MNLVAKNKRLTSQNLAKIKKALEEELSFQGEGNNTLVGKILDRIVVKKRSTEEMVLLDIYLKIGFSSKYILEREKASSKGNRF